MNAVCLRACRVRGAPRVTCSFPAARSAFDASQVLGRQHDDGARPSTTARDAESAGARPSACVATAWAPPCARTRPPRASRHLRVRHRATSSRTGAHESPCRRRRGEQHGSAVGRRMHPGRNAVCRGGTRPCRETRMDHGRSLRTLEGRRCDVDHRETRADQQHALARETRSARARVGDVGGMLLDARRSAAGAPAARCRPRARPYRRRARCRRSSSTRKARRGASDAPRVTLGVHDARSCRCGGASRRAALSQLVEIVAVQRTWQEILG